MANLCFNILTFDHPKEELRLYFTDKEDSNLTRIYHTLVPDEVIQEFGQQEHYYTSFEEEREGFFPVTKAVKPTYVKKLDQYGEEYSEKVRNTAYSISILKRYYNSLIHKYFADNGLKVKPNFIHDTEVWLPSKKYDSTGSFNLFDRYCLKVQFKTVSKFLELLVTFEGTSKVYKQSIDELQESVRPEAFNWVLFDEGLYKFNELPSGGKRAYNHVFPVWNFDIRDALGEPTEAPDRGNKYVKFKESIDSFYNTHINTEDFKKLIPINSKGFIPVEGKRLGTVKPNSNQLLFAESNKDNVPMNGMKKFGPYDTGTSTNIHFFYIVHESDKKAATTIHHHLRGNSPGFSGLSKFINIPYYPNKNLAIYYQNKDNPWPEVYEQIINTYFDPDIKYFAIYISPISKETTDKQQKRVYYKLKELLLKKKDFLSSNRCQKTVKKQKSSF